MKLVSGARTVIKNCLGVSQGEEVVVLNDGNDQRMVDAILEVLEEESFSRRYLEYDEPFEHGEEPPGNVAEAMKEADVFIAPTTKSISHTEARKEACETGTRGATLPGITQKIWKSTLQADYSRVKEITGKVYRELENTEKVYVETPSGTELRFEVEPGYFHRDAGMIRDPGSFGNLPAGEVDGYPVDAEGKLVIDHMPFVEDAEGAKLEIRSSEVKSIVENTPSRLSTVMDKKECVRTLAEFGFGTNPLAEVSGNILEDEKVLGTVHLALGDNTGYVPASSETWNRCGIHWDSVCLNPDVWFDETKVLERGEPVFLD